MFKFFGNLLGKAILKIIEYLLKPFMWLGRKK